MEPMESGAITGMQSVIEYYNNDQLFKAYEELAKIDLEMVNPTLAPFVTRLQREYEFAHGLYKEITCQHEDTLLVEENKEKLDTDVKLDENEAEQDASADNFGWKLVHETAEDPETQSTIKTYYKADVNESPLHALKVQAIIPVDMFSVLSMLYEIDMYKNWVPRMSKSSIIQEYPHLKYRFLAYFKFDLFWPIISDRDMVCYGFGIDLLEEERAILVAIHSIDDNESLRQHMKEHGRDVNDETTKDGEEAHDDTVLSSKLTKISCPMAGFYIKYLSEHQTEIRMIGQVDLNMNFMPSWLMNRATSNFAYKCVGYLSRMAKNVESDEDGEWNLRLQKQVYQDVKQRLNVSP